MWKTILDILFPIQCLGCNQEGKFLCHSCFKSIPLNTKETKDNLLISSYYKNQLVKELIHRYKYDFVRDLAKPLSLLMIERLKRENIENLILVPIPLHTKRLKWRGFNQSELLAREIGKKMDIPIFDNILIRTKYSLPQAKIQNADLRRENIKDSFELRKPLLTSPYQERNNLLNNSLPDKGGLGWVNKNIILVDDICTSGSTLDECVRALETLKPKNIYKLVIARE